MKRTKNLSLGLYFLFAIGITLGILFFPKSTLKPVGAKAVIEFSTDLGIVLNNEASKTIEIEVVEVKDRSRFAIPLSSIVYFEESRGIYRLRNNHFKLITLLTDKSGVIQLPSEFSPGDQVVTNGIGLLRVAELAAKRGKND